MKKRTILLFICIIMLLIAAVCGGAYYYFFSALEQDNEFAAATQTVEEAKETLNINEETSFDHANIVNIALFGVDQKSGDSGRSDATLILSIDYEHNKIKLTSLARDSLVYIPDKEVKEKLTHAYAYGGATLAVKTINTNYNTNITDYVAVNFSEMADIIDLVGGVNVNLTAKELSQLSNQSGLSAGDVTLNGAQAVEYSRIRKIDTDDARTSRQREVLESLFTKARSMSATQYPGLIRECLGLCKTSLDYSEILSFSQILLQNDLTLEQLSIPSDNIESWSGIMSSSKAWCYVYDTRVASDAIMTFIYEDLYTNANINLPEATIDMSYAG